MGTTDQSGGPADPFGRAWADFFTRMGSASAAMPGMPSPNWPDETARQMQRAFFDALARYCEEYMRSPAFLGMMKQTMDQSLAFKQQIDRFLTDAQRQTQGAAQSDLQDIAELLRNIEGRLLERIEALEQRVAGATHAAATRRPAARPQASTKSTKKKRGKKR